MTYRRGPWDKLTHDEILGKLHFKINWQFGGIRLELAFKTYGF